MKDSFGTLNVLMGAFMTRHEGPLVGMITVSVH
jgi:hypothetical protein